jgi:hypothetical protein
MSSSKDFDLDYNEEEILSNRQKSRIAKLGESWCCGCDRNIIGDGEICKVCGYRHKTKKKKESRFKTNQYKSGGYE